MSETTESCGHPTNRGTPCKIRPAMQWEGIGHSPCARHMPPKDDVITDVYEMMQRIWEAGVRRGQKMEMPPVTVELVHQQVQELHKLRCPDSTLYQK